MNGGDIELRETSQTEREWEEKSRKMKQDYDLRNRGLTAWTGIAVVFLLVFYFLGTHLSDTRRHVATEQARAEIARSDYARQMVARYSAGTSGSVPVAEKRLAHEATSLTIHAVVESLYSTQGKSRATLPVESIIGVVQQFLDWGAIPKDAATNLIKELKDFAKPIAIEAVKTLLTNYLSGRPPHVGGGPSSEGGVVYSGSTLVCNSFNTSPTRTVLAPPPPKPRPPKARPVAEPSCSATPSALPPK